MRVRQQPFEGFSKMVFALLGEPMTRDHLDGWIARALPHVVDRQAVIDRILDSDRLLHELPGGWICRLDALFDSVTLTHRVTPTEIEAGLLFGGAWTGLVQGIGSVHCDGDLVTVSTRFDEDHQTTVISGLESRLASAGPGTLWSLTVADGGLQLGVGAEEADLVTDGLIAAFAAAYDDVAQLDREQVVDVATVVEHGLRVDAEQWRTTVPPLDELAAAAGLQIWRDRVAAASFDLERWHRDRPIAGSAARFGLDSDETLDLRRAVDDYRQWRASDGTLTPTVGRQPTAASLLEPAVAAAFIRGLSEYGDEDLDDIATFARAVAELVDPEYATGCRWIEAFVAGRSGDLATQERLLQEVLALDDGHTFAATDLGWLLVDQSRYVDAHRWLSVDSHNLDDPIFDRLAHLTAPNRAKSGRNDPCSCGSGRKFKRCHGAPAHRDPLVERIPLLYDKVARRVAALDGVPDWWRWPGQWSDDSARWRRGLDELDELGLLVDILLNEGGGLAQYIDERGSLLPADELAVLRRWAETPRRLWRVAKADPEAGWLGLEALGDRGQPSVEVQLGELPVDLSVEGVLLIARPLPSDGDRWYSPGGMLVIDEADSEQALRMIGTPGPPDATARQLIEVGQLLRDPYAERLICTVLLDADDSADLDRWLEAKARVMPPVPFEELTGIERRRDDLDPDDLLADGDLLDEGLPYDADLDDMELPDEASVFFAGDRFGARRGPLLAVVSMSEEEHNRTVDEFSEAVPSGIILDEQAVTAAVLFEEYELYGDEDDEVLGDRAVEALLSEAVALLNR